MDTRTRNNTWVMNPSDHLDKFDYNLKSEENLMDSHNNNIDVDNIDPFLDLDTELNNFYMPLDAEGSENGSPADDLDNFDSLTALPANEAINWDDFDFDVSPTADAMQGQNLDNLGVTELDNTNLMVDGSMTTLETPLLQKQKELNEALLRQREVNSKLERELKQTRLQQMKLQNKLREQENLASKRFALGDITSSSRLNRTPSGKENIFAQAKSANSSPSKKQHTSKLSFVSPSSNTTVYGSPKRRTYRAKAMILNKDLENNRSAAKDQKIKIDFETSLAPTVFNNNENASLYSSPTQSRRPSIASSPVQPDSSNVSPVVHADTRRNSTKRNSITFIPLINNFNKRSPSGRKSYTLNNQDSPIRIKRHVSKGNTRDLQLPPPLANENIKGTSAFRDLTKAPQLAPPNEFSSVIIEDSPVLSPDQPGNTELEWDRESKGSSQEPESVFVMSQTSSPVLKSQGHFDGESPTFGYHSRDIDTLLPISPLKITRKRTTLPRGSIDRYVKELPDKSFECLYPECKKLFKRRYNIRSHIQTHLEDRPYTCDFPGCTKAFVRNHDLVRHKKSHSEKAYGCPCGKMFNREDAMIVHRSRMICVGGKKYENVVIKRSPRKRGRPRRESLTSDEFDDENHSVDENNRGATDITLF
ncbi:DNA-binding transcription factor SWI5 KNAG_0A05170 [Huiozyma naganishii CBS 8797]|uniref:C2H2-type domain-containing protein n=1 Tax=Huiozyma naganishii (strain ATCC MYA-139 / BCRC 22969 / CBS 8797 / KCTC 17520 / NBRC 10181 / NCYC 3082 / Yp74L-3) TaxID=1071383 RepID=J7RF43_HUIN7|nr:hypothetical protein KNAG_0A05170 [Kazachstania naganishii CBS 8797]CCK68183.1 hypothetical protein KNAG_0A05170 [Kazachstania naganishii CBS 8797]